MYLLKKYAEKWGKTPNILKLEYLGHIMRNGRRYGLLQTIVQGKIPGKRDPGRWRNSWLKNSQDVAFSNNNRTIPFSCEQSCDSQKHDLINSSNHSLINICDNFCTNGRNFNGIRSTFIYH